jgi:hypothetical protein
MPLMMTWSATHSGHSSITAGAAHRPAVNFHCEGNKVGATRGGRHVHGRHTGAYDGCVLGLDQPHSVEDCPRPAIIPEAHHWPVDPLLGDTFGARHPVPWRRLLLPRPAEGVCSSGHWHSGVRGQHRVLPCDSE